MNSVLNSLSTELAKQLNCLQPQQFTGRLEVKSPTLKKWTLYFGLGEIVWASDSYHPYRSWLRHLQQFCPLVELESQTYINKAQEHECYKYFILIILCQEKIITSQQFKQLISHKITEAIFDILQQEATTKLQYNWRSESIDLLAESGLKMSLFQVNVEQALKESQQVWFHWCEKDFQDLSPNLAPFIKEPNLLQQELPVNVYENLIEVIDGKHTLRDLAVKIGQDVLDLTCSLMPYIHKKYIDFKEVTDLEPRITSFILETPYLSNIASKPLIACIDDSPEIIKVMEQIVIKAGFRYIGIQEPLQAVSTLIVSYADLIFLDIEMPIINGYEVCAQLRRVSTLKNVPIIMLTDKGNIVDRLRVKIVGASGFLSKPVESLKILKMVEKYLSGNVTKVIEELA